MKQFICNRHPGQGSRVCLFSLFLSGLSPTIACPCQTLTNSQLMVLIFQWCDSDWEWCQLLDDQPNKTTPTKPNLAKLNLELLIELKYSRKQKNLTLWPVVPLATFISVVEEEEREKLGVLWEFQPLRNQIGQPHLQFQKTKKLSKWKFLKTYKCIHIFILGSMYSCSAVIAITAG